MSNPVKDVHMVGARKKMESQTSLKSWNTLILLHHKAKDIHFLGSI